MLLQNNVVNLHSFLISIIFIKRNIFYLKNLELILVIILCVTCSCFSTNNFAGQPPLSNEPCHDGPILEVSYDLINVAPFDNDLSDGIFGRKIVKVPELTSVFSQPIVGEISVKVCIDRFGAVIYSEIINEETTVSNQVLLKKARGAARKYCYENDLNADEIQCGKLIFLIDIK